RRSPRPSGPLILIEELSPRRERHARRADATTRPAIRAQPRLHLPAQGAHGRGLTTRRGARRVHGRRAQRSAHPNHLHRLDGGLYKGRERFNGVTLEQFGTDRPRHSGAIWNGSPAPAWSAPYGAISTFRGPGLARSCSARISSP